MMKTMLIAARATIFTLVLTGLAYPLAVTGIAQVLFPSQANGSLVLDERQQVIGSELLGQTFTSTAYFNSRPSAAGAGYDAAASSGSNLGPTSAKLKDRVAADLLRLGRVDPNGVPAELLTASASGLDPHLSPEGASWQAPRVAAARGVTVERVRSLVESRIEGRQFLVLGEPRVNVLRLNLAMDRQFGKPPKAQPVAAP